jgi:hypothetical protein
MRKLVLIACLALLSQLPACLSIGGGDTDVQVNGSSVSKGKELTDLQRALQQGAISQVEYDRLHKVILRRAN